MLTPKKLAAAARSVLAVGDGGRGFVVRGERPGDRCVITAAHCLPQLPPAHPFAFGYERTYPLVAPLTDAAHRIAAECLFVDPIADLAVVVAPDGQSDLFADDCDAYEALTDACVPFRIGPLTAPGDGWLLTLAGDWEPCRLRVNEYGPARSVTLIGAQRGNVGGCSGSPILAADGRVVGVISVGNEVNGVTAPEQHGQPLLAGCLPRWLWTALKGRPIRMTYVSGRIDIPPLGAT